MSSRRGFTLIELLVVIAIIAILAVVVVLTLNPANLLAQSRDANRVSDMATLNTGVNLYVTDQANNTISIGNANTSYISIPSSNSACGPLGLGASAYNYACSTAANYRMASTSGWVPVAFNQISAGSPFSITPTDPVNQTSSNLYYRYEEGSSTYAFSAFFESQKYAKNMENSPGVDPGLYQIGSGVASLPSAASGLAGYWPLSEGAGTTAKDWSGNASTGTFSGSPTWTTNAHVWSNGLQITNGNFVSFPTAGSLPTSSITVALWENVNTSSFVSYQQYLSNSWTAQPGSWLFFSNSIGTLEWGVTGPATTTQNLTTCPSALTLNTWQFIAATYNGATLSLYLNGSPCGTPTALASQPLYPGGSVSTNMTAGASVIENDVRIYNRALSASEIQQLYNSEK